MQKEKKVALVTGGSRGLGFELCRQLGQLGFIVILTARHTAQGREQMEVLKNEKLDVHFHDANVNDTSSLGTLYEYVLSNFGRLDVLVNCAGILVEKSASSGDDLFERLRHEKNILSLTLETNTIGPYLLCKAFCPVMRKRRYGRIVNISSSMGQLSDMQEGYDAFRISKTGLNAVTKIFAAQHKGYNVLVNSVCPGWISIDSNKPEASENIMTAADSIVWAATLPDGGPTGGFFRNKKPIPW